MPRGIDWDAENERLLLLAVLDVDRQVNYEKTAKILGDGFTASSVRQRFYKLKREADALIAKSGNGDGSGDTTPKTPAAKKSAAKPKTSAKTSAKASAKSTGRGRKRKTSGDEAEVEDPSDNDETPSKKQKLEEPEEPIVKQDSSTENGD